ncbi:MAG: cobalamin-dependent protein [Thermoanaerobaculia bacterium]|nr:cobalamin-dependent protein [Thermoanaerobaculia bacterium]
MRILLVKPRARLRTILGLERFQRLEPLELGYVAAAVPPGHEVRVLDLRLSRRPERRFARTLREFAPDLLGITAYTHEAVDALALARAGARLLPRLRSVVGGHHATVRPADFDDEAVAAVVRGEGCGPMRAIVERLSRREPLDGIPHVWVPGGRAALDEWPSYPDPATLPVPRRDLWRAADYHCVWTAESPRPWQPLFPATASVRASWGCRMRCTFCVVPFLSRGHHHARPVAAVADEIAALEANHVYFVDDEGFLDEEHAAALAEALAGRGVRKRYHSWARATTVLRSPELFRRWREVGLDTVFVGFEFSSDEELKAVQKGATVAANERALDRLRAMGIAVHAGFMVRAEYGEEEFDRLRSYVDALPPAECSFTVCTPSPGTEDHERMEGDFWVDDPRALHDCMHPLTPTRLPLRRFAARYAEQVAAGIARTPLRAERHPIRPPDLARALWAERRYVTSYRELYRDYPRALWNAGADRETGAA